MSGLVLFSTREFERAHGKQPGGRGSWGFCPSANYNKEDYLDHVFWFNGTYREARAAARKHFWIKGVREVTICS